MSSLLAVGEAAKAYGAKRLLDVAGLALDAGDLVILSGDNGSGKTTLLKLLAGLERADRLRMRFDGIEATEREFPGALRRTIVYVHQHPYLFNTSIADNIAAKASSPVRNQRNPMASNDDIGGTVSSRCAYCN